MHSAKEKRQAANFRNVILAYESKGEVCKIGSFLRKELGEALRIGPSNTLYTYESHQGAVKK